MEIIKEIKWFGREREGNEMKIKRRENRAKRIKCKIIERILVIIGTMFIRRDMALLLGNIAVLNLGLERTFT